MIIYSTIFRPLFWIVMGLVYAVIIASAGLWADDLGLQMTWWKWLLAAAWYGLLSYTFAGAFTLLGEKEPGAWYRFLGFHLIVTIISGAVFWYLVWFL
jgi:hypothetical protein